MSKFKHNLSFAQTTSTPNCTKNESENFVIKAWHVFEDSFKSELAFESYRVTNRTSLCLVKYKLIHSNVTTCLFTLSWTSRSSFSCWELRKSHWASCICWDIWALRRNASSRCLRSSFNDSSKFFTYRRKKKQSVVPQLNTFFNTENLATPVSTYICAERGVPHSEENWLVRNSHFKYCELNTNFT